MIKISVIVPVYNAEKYLDRCIESIRSQTLQDIEIILINDGSKDDSLNLCKRYAKEDNRIKVINKINGGPSETRNVGIDLANGEYITFVDSDDWIDCNMFENLYNKINKTNCNIIISNYFRNYLDREECIKLDIKQEYLEKEEIKKQLIFPLIGKDNLVTGQNSILGFCSPWGKLFKRELLLKEGVKFNKDLFIGEDLLFNIELLSKVNCVIIDENAYYHYFNNASSILNSYKQDFWNIYIKLIKEIEEYLNKNNYKNEIGDRFTIMKLDGITKAIFNECKSTNEKNIYKRIKYIDDICKDEVTRNTLKEIDNIKLDFKRKIGKVLIKYNISTILYVYYSKKNK